MHGITQRGKCLLVAAPFVRFLSAYTGLALVRQTFGVLLTENTNIWPPTSRAFAALVMPCINAAHHGKIAANSCSRVDDVDEMVCARAKVAASGLACRCPSTIPQEQNPR